MSPSRRSPPAEHFVEVPEGSRFELLGSDLFVRCRKPGPEAVCSKHLRIEICADKQVRRRRHLFVLHRINSCLQKGYTHDTPLSNYSIQRFRSISPPLEQMKRPTHPVSVFPYLFPLSMDLPIAPRRYLPALPLLIQWNIRLFLWKNGAPFISPYC